MRRQQCGSLTLYSFPALEEAGAHNAIATRLGGVSQGHLAALNVSYSVGDQPASVAHNRRLLYTCLGAEERTVVGCHQVHTATVAKVSHADGGRGALVPGSGIPSTDALVTDASGLYLFMSFADCVPVLLYDPVRRVLGLAHAGWKGTASNIAARTVSAMTQGFACDPQDIIAAVGPAIGPCHYTVREDVASAMRAALPFWPDVLRTDGDGHMSLNLPEANRRYLLDAGLRLDNVHMSGLCTACHTDEFYSHRAEKGKTGRFGVVVWMQS